MPNIVSGPVSLAPIGRTVDATTTILPTAARMSSHLMMSPSLRASKRTAEPAKELQMHSNKLMKGDEGHSPRESPEDAALGALAMLAVVDSTKYFADARIRDTEQAEKGFQMIRQDEVQPYSKLVLAMNAEKLFGYTPVHEEAGVGGGTPPCDECGLPGHYTLPVARLDVHQLEHHPQLRTHHCLSIIHI